MVVTECSFSGSVQLLEGAAILIKYGMVHLQGVAGLGHTGVGLWSGSPDRALEQLASQGRAPF
eukprot:15933768-Heterocapsa_arctica.AAC.1